MPKEITVPRLGWSMEEGVFAEWLKAPGDDVRAGEMVFLLEGEKAVHEIESFDSGRLWIPADAPRPGETVRVGQVIGFLLAEGEIGPASVGRPPAAPITSAQPPASAIESVSKPAYVPSPIAHSSTPPPAGPAARRLARLLGIDLQRVPTPDPTGRVIPEDIYRAASAGRGLTASTAMKASTIASPRARRRAKELGVDWRYVSGTGRAGRVRERDVVDAAAAGINVSPAATRSPAASAASAVEIPPTAAGTHKPADKLRRNIAARMSAGVHQAAPVTLTTKIDASALIAARRRDQAAADGRPVASFNDRVIYHAARVLRALPDLNRCWFRDGLYTYDDVHLAFAVDTPAGLVAPVVRNADQRSLVEIAAETKQLIERARVGRLTQEELQGGTFTVSNLGMYGIDAFTPILNLPQSAILGVGRIVHEPVVREDQIVPGATLTLSLTFDHRALDGAPAARWLQALCELLQGDDAGEGIPL